VLGQAGLLSNWKGKPSKKGTGFEQPLAAHQHWHIDVSYINISGTFYYLCSILDGCSRYIVNWDLRESMTEAEIEILEWAKELHPEARPRIISDNGPQFIAKDFKEFIRISGMTHVRTSPYYPQSNGKIEHWHKSLKGECIRPGTPLSLEDAAASGRGLHRSLQQCAPEQCYRLHHPEGHARRATAGDPRRARSEVGGGAKTAAGSPGSRLRDTLWATVREAHFRSGGRVLVNTRAPRDSAFRAG
jgi:transposase InsO family protein